MNLKSRFILAFFLALGTFDSLAQSSAQHKGERDYLELIIRTAMDLRAPMAPEGVERKEPLLDVQKCGTPLQIEIARHWREFSPEEQVRLLQASSRPTLQTSKVTPSGFFRIHYDTTGVNAPALLDGVGQRIEGTFHAFVDSAAWAFEYSWQVEVDDLGFLRPPTDAGEGGGAEYDVYVRDLRAYGVTWWTGEQPIDTTRPNYTTRSYIEIENDFRGFQTPGLAGLKVTAAHELHHAIQVGGYGLWSDDQYYYELTSTWMEEMVYDEINDYYFWIPLYFKNIDIPFNRSDGPLEGPFAGYERAVWGIFLTDRHGAGVMRRTWEEMVQVPSLDAIERALNAYGDSFNQSFVEFFLWNFYTAFRSSGDLYYDEAMDYPPIRILSRVDLSSGTAKITSTAKPLSSHYHQVVSAADTVTIITINRDIESAKSRKYLDSEYSYDLSTSDGGNAFLKLPNGVRVRFSAQNLSLWQSVFLINNEVAGDAGEEPNPYPNPFVLNGFDVLAIPIAGAVPQQVTLYIFTSNLELVYSRTLQPSTFLGRFVVTWNGRNNDGETVRSGIYFYILESVKGTTKGKFAVIQQ